MILESPNMWWWTQTRAYSDLRKVTTLPEHLRLRIVSINTISEGCCYKILMKEEANTYLYKRQEAIFR